MFVVTLISFLLFDAVCCSGQWHFIEKQLQPMEKWFFKINWENQNTGVTAYVYFIHILDYLHSTFTQLCGFQKRKKNIPLLIISSGSSSNSSKLLVCWFFFSEKKTSVCIWTHFHWSLLWDCWCALDCISLQKKWKNIRHEFDSI